MTRGLRVLTVASLLNGLTAGLVLYPIVELLAGRKVNDGAMVLALICLSYYLFGLPH